MSEVSGQVAEQVANVENKEGAKNEQSEVGSFGKLVQATRFNVSDYEDSDVIKPGETEEAETGKTSGSETDKKVEDKKTENELSDEQITKYLEKKGIVVKSLDELKEKVSPETIVSPEEQKKAALAAEKELVDIFVEGGGTVDQFVAIKKLAEQPVKELSIESLKSEYKGLGFTEEEANDLIKERYYQISDEDLELLDDADKARQIKLRDAFSKKLENKAAYKKTQAEKILADLKSVVESDKVAKENEVKLAAKIDAHFKKLPRTVTFEIGESNGKPISPVNFEVSEDDITEVKELLKNPEKRKQFIQTSDNDLNTAFAELLLQNKYLKTAVKTAFLEGGSRQAGLIQNHYPTNVFELGIGGSNKEKFVKGQAVSFGKAQRVVPAK